MVPYLTRMTEAAPQRDHSMRELFNAFRQVSRYGMAWRAGSNGFASCAAVHRQLQRWSVRDDGAESTSSVAYGGWS
ncbi:MAG: transposase [Oxalobacteraceae bacterium]|nr:MAG: transposase [Oxalobacteraceae bacterium]